MDEALNTGSRSLDQYIGHHKLKLNMSYQKDMYTPCKTVYLVSEISNNNVYSHWVQKTCYLDNSCIPLEINLTLRTGHSWPWNVWNKNTRHGLSAIYNYSIYIFVIKSRYVQGTLDTSTTWHYGWTQSPLQHEILLEITFCNNISMEDATNTRSFIKLVYFNNPFFQKVHALLEPIKQH